MKNQQKSTEKVPLKEKQKAFVEAYIKHMGNISKACEDIGIDRGTYYKWMKKPTFQKRYDEALEKHNDLIYQRILNLALKEDKDMLKFWAKTQMKHRGFVEKTEVELSGSMNNPLIIEEHLHDGKNKDTNLEEASESPGSSEGQNTH